VSSFGVHAPFTLTVALATTSITHTVIKEVLKILQGVVSVMNCVHAPVTITIKIIFILILVIVIGFFFCLCLNLIRDRHSLLRERAKIVNQVLQWVSRHLCSSSGTVVA